MKKAIESFLLFIVSLFYGCGIFHTAENKFNEILKESAFLENMTVSVEFSYTDGSACTELYEFAGNASHLKTADSEYWFYRENGVCFILVYDEENNVWIRSKTDITDYLDSFYLYEKLSKLKYYSDSGFLDYSLTKKEFSGSDLCGQYVIQQTVFKPDSLKITLNGEGYVKKIEETTDEAVVSTSFSLYGTTAISLPLNVIDESEISRFDSLYEISF